MNRDRRTFLASVGTIAVGGCVGHLSDSSQSDDTGSPDEIPTPAETATPVDNEPLETMIGFGGDTMVGRQLNQIYAKEGADPATIWGDLRPRLESLDGVFCNLECCLSTRGERFPNRSYYFRGNPEWAVPALSAGNIQFTSLANNHMMDFGEVALTDTIDVLEKKGIEVAGAGENPVAARAPATFSIGDLDIAVVSFSDRSKVYRATDDRPGIAYAKADHQDSETQRVVGDSIERAQSENPDLLVASVHWGPNWIERPAGHLVAFGHWLVDRGGGPRSRAQCSCRSGNRTVRRRYHPP